MTDLPSWDRDAAAIAAAIARRPAPLKLILKTRDDPFFLEDWIRHHAAIAGLENLLVFDNLSVRPEVLDIYARYRRDGLTVIRFAAWRNDLHNTAVFRDLYAALARAATWFCALDTDEALVLLRDRRHAAGGAILDFLRAHPACDAFPAMWLASTDARRDRFTLGRTALDRLRPMRAGKPVLRSGAAYGPYINHNCQVAWDLYGPATRTNLAVLHLVNLSRAQRIDSCRIKLVASGFAAPEETADAAAARDLGGNADPAVLKYHRELRLLLGDDPIPRDPAAALRPGCLELRPDGAIACYGAAERAVLRDVLERPDRVIPWLR